MRADRVEEHVLIVRVARQHIVDHERGILGSIRRGVVVGRVAGLVEGRVADVIRLNYDEAVARQQFHQRRRLDVDAPRTVREDDQRRVASRGLSAFDGRQRFVNRTGLNYRKPFTFKDFTDQLTLRGLILDQQDSDVISHWSMLRFPDH